MVTTLMRKPYRLEFAVGAPDDRNIYRSSHCYYTRPRIIRQIPTPHMVLLATTKQEKPSHPPGFSCFMGRGTENQ